MDDTIDALQIKIEEAKRRLPIETVNAIDAVNWREAILELRTKYGYTYEQLGDLELETELVLCGLLSPENYSKELEKSMGIPKEKANELVNEMNTLVFKKIREELIKNTDRKKMFANKNVIIKTENEGKYREPIPEISMSQTMKNIEEKSNTQVLKSAGIEIIEKIPADLGGEPLPIPEKLEIETIPAPIITPNIPVTGKIKEEVPPMLAQKISNSFKIPMVKTEYSLNNISKTGTSNSADIKTKIPNIDPYREIPE